MRRKAMRVRLQSGADVFASTEKPFMRKLPARCVSSSIRRAHAVVADNGLEPRQGYIESRRLGRLRRKQPKLHLA